MNLESDYNNYLEEIRKEPKLPEIKLILADKLYEDDYEGIAKLVRWFAKYNKWFGFKNKIYDDPSWVKGFYFCVGREHAHGIPRFIFNFISDNMKKAISNRFYIDFINFTNELLFLEELAKVIQQQKDFFI